MIVVVNDVMGGPNLVFAVIVVVDVMGGPIFVLVFVVYIFFALS